MATPTLIERLTPSARPHGAQLMFSMTTLVVEAFIVFFAVLVAHQLLPEDRVLNWTWGLLTAAALMACSRMLKRGPWPYVAGAVLQIPMLLLGLQVTPMWFLGGGMALLYVYGVLKGNQLDREKDAIDRRVIAERAAEEGAAPGDGPSAQS